MWRHRQARNMSELQGGARSDPSMPLLRDSSARDEGVWGEKVQEEEERWGEKVFEERWGEKVFEERWGEKVFEDMPDDDDEWRQHGHRRRIALLEDEIQNGGDMATKLYDNTLVLSHLCPIERYYEIGDKVLIAFHNAQREHQAENAFVLGHRLIMFLSKAMPTHIDYRSGVPEHTRLRKWSMQTIELVRQSLAFVSDWIDVNEHNKFVERQKNGEDERQKNAEDDEANNIPAKNVPVECPSPSLSLSLSDITDEWSPNVVASKNGGEHLVHGETVMMGRLGIGPMGSPSGIDVKQRRKHVRPPLWQDGSNTEDCSFGGVAFKPFKTHSNSGVSDRAEKQPRGENSKESTATVKIKVNVREKSTVGPIDEDCEGEGTSNQPSGHRTIEHTANWFDEVRTTSTTGKTGSHRGEARNLSQPRREQLYESTRTWRSAPNEQLLWEIEEDFGGCLETHPNGGMNTKDVPSEVHDEEESPSKSTSNQQYIIQGSPGDFEQFEAPVEEVKGPPADVSEGTKQTQVERDEPLSPSHARSPADVPVTDECRDNNEESSSRFKSLVAQWANREKAALRSSVPPSPSRVNLRKVHRAHSFKLDINTKHSEEKQETEQTEKHKQNKSM